MTLEPHRIGIEVIRFLKNQLSGKVVNRLGARMDDHSFGANKYLQGLQSKRLVHSMAWHGL